MQISVKLAEKLGIEGELYGKDNLPLKLTGNSCKFHAEQLLTSVSTKVMRQDK